MRSLTELVDGGVVRADGVAASGVRRWLATTVPLVVIVLVLGGCGVVPGTVVDAVFLRDVPSLAWSADGWVYFVENVDDGSDVLWRQRKSEGAERLELDNGDCGYPSYLFVARVVDGTAIVGRRCEGETTELVSVSEGRFGAAVARFDSLLEGVAWDLRRDRGFVARRDGYGDCDSLAPATSAGIGQFRQELSVDGGRWWADSLFRFGEEFDCESLGDAISPAFDPTGTKLYFLASAKAAGISNGYDRLLSSASLVVMDVEDESVTRLVPGFSNVRATAVSADGGSVVVSAARDGESGVWLVQTSGTVKRLARGLHGSVDISPDSKTVAAVKLENRDSIEFIKIR